MIIRRATRKDAETLLNCVVLLGSEYGFTDAANIDLQDFTEAGFGNDPMFEAFLAESDTGELRGAISFFRGFSGGYAKPTAYVHMLFITKENRGQGVGRALLAKVAKLVVARGWVRLELLADHGGPAIPFYETMGMASGGMDYFCIAGDELISLAKSS